MFRWIFVNRNLYAPNLPFNNIIIARKRKCCSMEDRMVVANGCRKTTKLVWHGRERLRLMAACLTLFSNTEPGACRKQNK